MNHFTFWGIYSVKMKVQFSQAESMIFTGSVQYCCLYTKPFFYQRTWQKSDVCNSNNIFSMHQEAASTVGFLIILHGNPPPVSHTDLLIYSTPFPWQTITPLSCTTIWYKPTDYSLKNCKRGQRRALCKRTADWNCLDWVQYRFYVAHVISHKIRFLL